MCRILILEILDLWDTSSHAVVSFALGKNLLFNYVLGRRATGKPQTARFCRLYVLYNTDLTIVCF